MLSLLLATLLPAACREQPEDLDLVLVGGRVMDPETGLDAVRNVGIRNGSVVAITEEELSGAEIIDADGLVVAPGFIDLHAHGQDLESSRFQAADGVTTALELEIGVYPVASWYASREGRALINFGASVGHQAARIKLMHGLEVGHIPSLPPEERSKLREGDYLHRKASDEEVEELATLIEEGLEQGGLGLGFLLGYTSGATHAEILRLLKTAAENQMPAWVHLRAPTAYSDQTVIGPFQELIANAAITGVSVHIVHLNSTAADLAKVCLEMIRGAQRQGLDITTEAYPYTASCTRIEYARFADWTGDYNKLQWMETGEYLTQQTFEQYRRQGGWMIIHGRSEEMNEWLVSQPDVIAASDGITFLGGRSHPRGAGTFARILGYYSRERKALSLMEAIRKMTLLPARRLERAVPEMTRKGRVQVGADADLTLFDPLSIIDRATYERPDQYSAGIVHVLVGGTFVVRDSTLVEEVAPGKAIRGHLARPLNKDAKQ